MRRWRPQPPPAARPGPGFSYRLSRSFRHLGLFLAAHPAPVADGTITLAKALERPQNRPGTAVVHGIPARLGDVVVADVVAVHVDGDQVLGLAHGLAPPALCRTPRPAIDVHGTGRRLALH